MNSIGIKNPDIRVHSQWWGSGDSSNHKKIKLKLKKFQIKICNVDCTLFKRLFNFVHSTWPVCLVNKVGQVVEKASGQEGLTINKY